MMKIRIQRDQNIRRFYVPNSIFYMRPLIAKLLSEAELELSEKQIACMTQKISEYVHSHKGCLLTDVEVLSKEGEYVHVEIYL